MNTNKCTSCGTEIPEGIQVCGHCLKRVGSSTGVHAYVRSLSNHCKAYRATHSSCDNCILRHHCENKICNWNSLFLPSDMADYIEPKKTMVTVAKEKTKKGIKGFLNKYFGVVYLVIAVFLAVLVFSAGVLFGSAQTSETVADGQIVVEEQSYNAEPTYWLIETKG